MYLKNYQIKVITSAKRFLSVADSEYQKHKKVKSIDATLSHDWIGKTFENLSLKLNDKSKDGLGNFYPRVVIKVPTGGGKTLLAVETIREY